MGGGVKRPRLEINKGDPMLLKIILKPIKISITCKNLGPYLKNSERWWDLKKFSLQDFVFENCHNLLNTSLAVLGALTHRLQRRTACKIQNGRRGLEMRPTLGLWALPSKFAK